MKKYKPMAIPMRLDLLLRKQAKRRARTLKLQRRGGRV